MDRQGVGDCYGPSCSEGESHAGSYFKGTVWPCRPYASCSFKQIVKMKGLTRAANSSTGVNQPGCAQKEVRARKERKRAVVACTIELTATSSTQSQQGSSLKYPLAFVSTVYWILEALSAWLESTR